MDGKYDVIKKLIDLWESYENESPDEQDLLNFSEWW